MVWPAEGVLGHNTACWTVYLDTFTAACAEEVVLGRAGGRWNWTQYGQVVGRWQYPTTIGHVVPNLWIQGAKKNTRAVYNIVQLSAFIRVHAIYGP